MLGFERPGINGRSNYNLLCRGALSDRKIPAPHRVHREAEFFSNRKPKRRGIRGFHSIRHIPEIPKASMLSEDIMSVLDEEAIYAEVFSELTSDKLHIGVWAKAFAESEGDEKKSQALYVRRRFEQELARRQNIGLSQQDISGSETSDELQAAEESSMQLPVDNKDMSFAGNQTEYSTQTYIIEQRRKYQYLPSMMIGVLTGLTINTFFRHGGVYIGWLPNIVITLVATLVFMGIEDKIRKLLRK